jgi:hypothetical protein
MVLAAVCCQGTRLAIARCQTSVWKTDWHVTCSTDTTRPKGFYEDEAFTGISTGVAAMEPNPARVVNLLSGDAEKDKPNGDSFVEEADESAFVENLVPDTQGSPIKRYLYSKLTGPLTDEPTTQRP